MMLDIINFIVNITFKKKVHSASHGSKQDVNHNQAKLGTKGT